MERVLQELRKFIEEIQITSMDPSPNQVKRETFTLLLSGISACRKVPGIPVHMGYERLYKCENEQAREELKVHLYRLYGVQDKESLENACYEHYTTGKEYEQFMTFWNDAPLFNRNELKDEGRKLFETKITFARQFYPFVKEKGFYAWDINERIGLCRLSYACGIISEKEFEELVDIQVRKAQVFYHSYLEYAISCLCGALYFMSGDQEELLSFLHINQNLIRHLLEEDGAWQRNAWYMPKEREWVQLLPHNAGCIVSKRIADEGKIGYMYREKPESDKWPDTGWRFFAGDEPQEYCDNPDNRQIWSLNDVCNIDPTILGYVEAAYGRAYGKVASNEWERER